MIQGLLATFGWAAFFLLIEKIGMQELEVSQTIRNFYYIALVPIIGFGSATKTYVSNYLSHNAERQQILQLLKRLWVLSIGSMLLISLVAIIIPELLLSLITNKPDVIADSVPVLHLILGAMVLFSAVSVLINSIAGSGRTMAVMVIEGTTIALYLVLSYYVVVVNYTNIYVVWSMEYVYFLLLGIISLAYIRKTRLLDTTGR